MCKYKSTYFFPPPAFMKGRESTLFFTLFFFLVNLESACVIAPTSVLVLSYLSFKTQEHSMVNICNSCSTKTGNVQQAWLCRGSPRVGPPGQASKQALVILGKLVLWVIDYIVRTPGKLDLE
jgi:hypothetical protein